MKKYKILVNHWDSNYPLLIKGEIKTVEQLNELGFIPEKRPAWFEPVPDEPQAVDKNGTPLQVGDLVTASLGNVGKITDTIEEWNGERVKVGEVVVEARSLLKITPAKALEILGIENPYVEELEDLKNQLAALQLPKVPPFVEPKKGVPYWAVRMIGRGWKISDYAWDGDVFDKTHTACNLAFNTEADAQTVANYLNAVLKAIRQPEPVETEKVEAWKPRVSEKYWFIKWNGKVDFTTNEDLSIDKEMIKLGNCFKTREEAKLFGEKLIAFWKKERGMND